MESSPLAQFKIYDLVPLHLGNYNISFTNSSLVMAITLTIIGSFFIIASRKAQAIPTSLQASAEMIYSFILKLLNENTSGKGEQYFPFIFNLFLFILVLNILGLIPHGFAVTSQIAITFALAIIVFIMVTAVAFIKHGWHFFSYFLPSGTPWFLAPLMIIIEFFTYCTRPISLSLRLAANMMSGHILIAVVAGFIMMIGLAGFLPISFIVVFTGFELFVAILQAYIFTILTCVYLNDAIHLH
jgi:F-type H+-transporting ATPase subunit a